MIMHIVILASEFATGVINEPVIELLILIIFKTGMDIYHWDNDEKAVSKYRTSVINQKVKKKIDAFLDEPKIIVSGKEIRYNNFEELKACKTL